MRLLVSVRTTIIILFHVCAGATSQTRRDEWPDTFFASEAAATTDLILTRANAIDGVHEKDKTDEARTITSEAVHMIDPNIERGETIAKLSSGLKSKPKPETQASTGSIAKIMEHEHWALMKKETGDWLLKQHVNPKTVFSYMKLESIFDQGMDIITMSHDPKLLLWFHYIIEYRHIRSKGSKYAAFNDKELLGLLVSHLEAQSLKLTLSLHDSSKFNPYIQAGILFDSYRLDPSLKSFATEMLTYMITHPTAKDFVLKLWLWKRESPTIIFGVLHLGDEHGPTGFDDLTVFTAWLDYVKKYVESGALDFKIGDLIRVQLSTMSMPRAKVMFESKALEDVLGNVNLKTGNLAAYLRDVWQRFPQHLFQSLRLSGEKITSDNFSTFAKGISYVAAYMKTKPFNGDTVFDLLNPAHSFDEVVRLFKELEHVNEHYAGLSLDHQPSIKDFAGRMGHYLSDPASMLKLPPLNMHPEDLWNSLFLKDVEMENIRIWFKLSVAYYRRVEKKNIDSAIAIVIHSLQNKIESRGIPNDQWSMIVKSLREEDARINLGWESLAKQTVKTSRKRKNPFT